MLNNSEYGAAHAVLRHARANEEAQLYDPPYPQESTPEISDLKKPQARTEQMDSTKVSSHLDSMILSCLMGRRIEQPGLVRSKDI